MTKIDDIDLEDISGLKDRGVYILDTTRATQAGDTIRIEGAKGGIYAREYERLELKYGADHPRTLEIVERIKINNDHVVALSNFHDAVSTPRPAASGGWGVDGFVRHSDGSPAEGLTVGAFDQDGNWYEELLKAETDSKGYFSITVDPLPEKVPEAVFIRAAKRNKLLKSNEVRLSPAPKKSERVELVIDDGSGKKETVPNGGKTGNDVDEPTGDTPSQTAS